MHATDVRIRAAVLPHTGAPLEVGELDLAGPQRGEVLVRLHASGVCSHRLPLDGIGAAFDLLRAGHARRAVITL